MQLLVSHCLAFIDKELYVCNKSSPCSRAQEMLQLLVIMVKVMNLVMKTAGWLSDHDFHWELKQIFLS